MLSYSLQESGREPLYEQICRLMRRDIQSGVLPDGMHLPSRRMFAQNLGVSVITVEHAYDQLIMEGYIYAQPRKGYYVADLKRGPGERARTGDRRIVNATVSDMAGVAETPPYFADFSSPGTEIELFPFDTWARISRRVLSDEREALLRRAPSGGVRPLREAIASHLRQFRGMDVSPRQIIVGGGSEYLYGLLIQLFGFDKVYASETPGYRKVSQVWEAFDVPVRMVPVDEQGLRVDALEKSGARIVHTSASHHFPTGITMPAARRYELLGWAGAAEGRYILEDDYDSELRMSGRILESLFSMDAGGRVVYINTFTRTLSPSVRIAYMVLPWALLERYEQRLGFYACPVPVQDQLTLARFIDEGFYEKHINRMRHQGRRKRDLLLECLHRQLGRRCRIREEHAGLHFLMELEAVPDDFDARLDALGIRLPHLAEYDPERTAGAYERTFVVQYASVPLGRIEEAVRRIAQAL